MIIISTSDNEEGIQRAETFSSCWRMIVTKDYQDSCGWRWLFPGETLRAQ